MYTTACEFVHNQSTFYHKIAISHNKYHHKFGDSLTASWLKIQHSSYLYLIDQNINKAILRIPT